MLTKLVQPDSRDESNPDSYGEDDHPDGPVNPSSVLSEVRRNLFTTLFRFNDRFN